MTKFIYIDIGTHFGQEFQSIFGRDHYFFLKIIRRILGYYIFKRGDVLNFIEIIQLYSLRKKIRSVKKNFEFYFIEANTDIVRNCKIYKEAQGVFNCALTNDINSNITKLYLANNDRLSQGSSILSSKKNVSVKNFMITIGIQCDSFFYSLKKYLNESKTEYKVILRLNCEGMEDDAIYAAKKIFQERLVLTMGSLKDVKELKGNLEYDKLIKFLNNNSLPFVSFSSLVSSWKEAFISINRIIKN